MYNDPTVVLRELTQNCIDAVKLKKFEIEEAGHNFSSKIKIVWNTNERTLCFMDNGTGMTLDIIQNHLLKVGSSRYQDENFKKKYPNFSPISRFGIGLLTCFLIADDVDITTKSTDSDKAILLKIRKVHGKYLLKYIDSNQDNQLIDSHGTNVKLYVRSDVNLSNIEADLQKWIIIPNCELELCIDDKAKKIGYDTPKQALTKYLEDIGYVIDDKYIKIHEVERDGINIAIALTYLAHFDEWLFLRVNSDIDDDTLNDKIGTCVEGVKVDFNTPGFLGKSIIALANTTGKNAPKTNVARSDIEATPESEALLVTIYELYLEHISNEMQSLRDNGFSISWAAREASWILNGLVTTTDYYDREVKMQDTKAFEKALSGLKCILLEKDNKREIVNAEYLESIGHYWTIDGASYRSADSLVREVKGSNTSSITLMKSIYGEQDPRTDHIDNLLCSGQTSRAVERYILYKYQVDSIRMISEQRRLDLRWSIVKDKIWHEAKAEQSNRIQTKIFIQLKNIEISTTLSQTAIKSRTGLFILKKSEISEFLIKLLNTLTSNNAEDELIFSRVISLVEAFYDYGELDKANVEELVDSRMERREYRSVEKSLWSKVDKQELLNALFKTEFTKYDTTVWDSRAD